MKQKKLLLLEYDESLVRLKSLRITNAKTICWFLICVLIIMIASNNLWNGTKWNEIWDFQMKMVKGGSKHTI